MNLLANSSSSEEDLCNEFDLDYSGIIPQESSSSSLSSSRISLPPDYSTSNRITNELFQVTSNLRETYRKRHGDQSKRLNNNKIEKLLQDLNQEEDTFELDDTVRTRVFKGRFKNPDSPYAKLPSLNRYFDENKENRDQTSKVTKPKPLVPILQPITNSLKRSPTRSPKRLCRPKHTQLQPQKSCIKTLDKSNIFLIESLTGLINDATKYATELNGPNADDYPLPEHENEVVQIPTNEEKNPKIAIIRMYKPKRFVSTSSENKNGFYNETEFNIYKDQQSSGVQVVSRSAGSSTGNSEKKTVRWADNIEW